MTENIDISKKSVVELKALAFDLLAQRDQINVSLNVLVAEMNKRQQEQPQEPIVEPIVEP